MTDNSATATDSGNDNSTNEDIRHAANSTTLYGNAQQGASSMIISNNTAGLVNDSVNINTNTDMASASGTYTSAINTQSNVSAQTQTITISQ